MEKQVLMPSTSLLSRGVVSFFFLFFSSFFAQGQKTLFTEGFDSDTIFTTNSWTKIKTNSKDTIKLGNPRWDTFKEHFDTSSVQSLLIPEPSPVNPQNESVLSPSISSLGEKALILTFYVKNLPLDLGTSSLNVWGSINDGLTYDTLWKSSAAKSVGVSWEYAHYWYKVRIELPALYDNQANVRIAFNYTFDASYGNSVYLDGVNLSSRPSHDIGIIKFVQPLSKGIYS
ncbi:MAG: choice-of-anchor J domain-containing protein, partial [Bacteroidales bacterium]